VRKVIFIKLILNKRQWIATLGYKLAMAVGRGMDAPPDKELL
jgi:hypothetical protein